MLSHQPLHLTLYKDLNRTKDSRLVSGYIVNMLMGLKGEISITDLSMIRVIIFIGILFSPLLANATNKSLSNDLAVEAIKIAEKDLESAIFLIQQSVVADPKNAKAWAIAGKIYLLSEDLQSAERFYKKAKALGPLLMDVKDLESLINNKKKEE